MQKALDRLNEYNNATGTVKVNVKIRPWLQDFDLGADYDAAMIGKQIKATQDALKDEYVGYMLWNPSSSYTKGGVQ